MRVISKPRLRSFWERHADAERPLESWYRVARKAKWRQIADVRMMYPQADIVGRCVVFNIGGNKYRLITHMNYRRQIVYVLFVFTHKQYDEEEWKRDCGC